MYRIEVCKAVGLLHTQTILIQKYVSRHVMLWVYTTHKLFVELTTDVSQRYSLCLNLWVSTAYKSVWDIDTHWGAAKV